MGIDIGPGDMERVGDGYVHESGAPGSPAIVFVHGGGPSGPMWQDEMERLAGEFHCLPPNLPSFGLTNRLAPISLSQTADLVAPLIPHMRMVEALAAQSDAPPGDLSPSRPRRRPFESSASSGKESPVSVIGLAAGRASGEIPESHRDLVECPPVAALTTVMPDGYPQTSVVWCDFDGECVRVNTMRGFAKERNMRRIPRVTLLCYDPRQPLRYLEIRGTVVETTEEGAGRHLDELASKYAGRSIRFFGECIPARFAETEIPVLCRIRPTHVIALDATRPGGEC